MFVNYYKKGANVMVLKESIIFVAYLSLGGKFREKMW
jgi:hypothetical protein